MVQCFEEPGGSCPGGGGKGNAVKAKRMLHGGGGRGWKMAVAIAVSVDWQGAVVSLV